MDSCAKKSKENRLQKIFPHYLLWKYAPNILCYFGAECDCAVLQCKLQRVQCFKVTQLYFHIQNFLGDEMFPFFAHVSWFQHSHYYLCRRVRKKLLKISENHSRILFLSLLLFLQENLKILYSLYIWVLLQKLKSW